jgi:hypothetical protein
LNFDEVEMKYLQHAEQISPNNKSIESLVESTLEVDELATNTNMPVPWEALIPFGGPLNSRL